MKIAKRHSLHALITVFFIAGFLHTTTAHASTVFFDTFNGTTINTSKWTETDTAGTGGTTGNIQQKDGITVQNSNNGSNRNANVLQTANTYSASGLVIASKMHGNGNLEFGYGDPNWFAGGAGVSYVFLAQDTTILGLITNGSSIAANVNCGSYVDGAVYKMVLVSGGGYKLFENNTLKCTVASSTTVDNKPIWLESDNYKSSYDYVIATNETATTATTLPTINPSITNIVQSTTGNTVTLTGTGTSWTAGTPGTPTFVVSGGGATITSQTVTDSTHATLTLSAGSTTGTILITDPSTDATTSLNIYPTATKAITFFDTFNGTTINTSKWNEADTGGSGGTVGNVTQRNFLSIANSGGSGGTVYGTNDLSSVATFDARNLVIAFKIETPSITSTSTRSEVLGYGDHNNGTSNGTRSYFINITGTIMTAGIWRSSVVAASASCGNVADYAVYKIIPTDGGGFKVFENNTLKCTVTSNVVVTNASIFLQGNYATPSIFDYVVATSEPFTSSTTLPTINPSITNIVQSTTGNTVTLTGTGTSWTAGTPGTPTFVVSGGGATITSQTVTDSTHATLTLSAGSTTGTILITDPSTDATVAMLVTPAITNLITVDNAAWDFSPYNWYVSGSSYASTNTPGAYAKINFTGTSAALSLDVSSEIAATLSPAITYPVIRWSVDGGTYITQQLLSTTTVIPLAQGLVSGSHTLRIEFIGADTLADRWNIPGSVVKILGLNIDTASTVSAPSVSSQKIIFYGDSITEGAWILGDPNLDISNNYSHNSLYEQSHLAFPSLIGNTIGAEYGTIGFGGASWDSTGGGNVPAFPSEWNYYYSGQTRLVSGLYSPAPTYLAVNMGTNGTLSAASVVTSWLSSARAATGANTYIELMIPFKGSNRSLITTGYNNYISANPGDTKTFLIDLGSKGVTYTNSTYSFDNLHPNAAGHAALANLLLPFFNTSGVTVSGPTSGQPTVASTNFTVTLANSATFDGSETVTIGDGSNGGTFTPSIGSPGTSTVTVTPTNGATSFTFTYTPATSGNKTLTFTNGQGWQNSTVSYNSIAPDSIAPTIALTAPATNTVVSGTNSSVAATASDNVGVIGVQFKLDGSNLQAEDTTSPYGITWDTTGTADGVHTLTAVARDAAANTTTSNSVSVTIDNTAPVRSAGAPTGVIAANTTSTTISLTTNEAATCRYSTSPGTAYGSMTAFSTTGGTTHSTTVSGLANNISYNYYVKCSDAYANTNATDYTISFSVAADITPPIVSAITANPTASAATIAWTTNEPSDSQLQYGLTTAYGTTTPLNSSLVTSHSISLSGLSATTTYHYRVISKDASANSTTSADQTFITTSSGSTVGITSGGSSTTRLIIPSNTTTTTSATTPSVSTTVSSNGVTLTQDLKKGDISSEVKKLQQFLNTHGYPVAKTGPGSKGKETNVFGPALQAALMKFQNAHAKQILKPAGLKKAPGTVGASTRKYINSL